MIKAAAALLIVFAGLPAMEDDYQPVQLPENGEFSDQNFSSELFALVPPWWEAPEAYSLPLHTSYEKRYIYGDAVLVSRGHGTAGWEVILEIKEPVSEDHAMAYAEIITGGHLPRFTSRNEGEIVLEETGKSGAGGRLVMSLDGNGLVTVIEWETWSP